MNSEARIALPAEEQARRRKAVSAAHWSSQMEGLGKPTTDEIAINELWVAGSISSEEHTRRIHELAQNWLRKRAAGQ
jgi:hypothetical protein